MPDLANMEVDSRKPIIFTQGFYKKSSYNFTNKGYLPRVIVIHIGNPFEQEIKEEVAQVSQQLEAYIGLGYEDIKFTL